MFHWIETQIRNTYLRTCALPALRKSLGKNRLWKSLKIVYLCLLFRGLLPGYALQSTPERDKTWGNNQKQRYGRQLTFTSNNAKPESTSIKDKL